MPDTFNTSTNKSPPVQDNQVFDYDQFFAGIKNNISVCDKKFSEVEASNNQNRTPINSIIEPKLTNSDLPSSPNGFFSSLSKIFLDALDEEFSESNSETRSEDSTSSNVDDAIESLTLLCNQLVDDIAKAGEEPNENLNKVHNHYIEVPSDGYEIWIAFQIIKCISDINLAIKYLNENSNEDSKEKYFNKLNSILEENKKKTVSENPLMWRDIACSDWQTVKKDLISRLEPKLKEITEKVVKAKSTLNMDNEVDFFIDYILKSRPLPKDQLILGTQQIFSEKLKDHQRSESLSYYSYNLYIRLQFLSNKKINNFISSFENIFDIFKNDSELKSSEDFNKLKIIQVHAIGHILLMKNPVKKNEASAFETIKQVAVSTPQSSLELIKNKKQDFESSCEESSEESIEEDRRNTLTKIPQATKNPAQIFTPETTKEALSSSKNEQTNRSQRKIETTPNGANLSFLNNDKTWLDSLRDIDSAINKYLMQRPQLNLGFFARVFEPNKGKDRAEAYQKVFSTIKKTGNKDDFNLLVYALLAHNDGTHLKKFVYTALNYDNLQAARDHYKNQIKHKVSADDLGKVNDIIGKIVKLTNKGKTDNINNLLLKYKTYKK